MSASRAGFLASVATMLAMLPAGSLPVEEREHERNKHAKPRRYPQSYCPSYHPLTRPLTTDERYASETETMQAAEAKRERKRAARLARKEPCKHLRLHPDVFDQTAGVVCDDCDFTTCCWRDEHVSEALWNRACTNSRAAVPCEQSRDDVCAICGEPMTAGGA